MSRDLAILRKKTLSRINGFPVEIRISHLPNKIKIALADIILIYWNVLT
jgi:hypothetical protein